MMAIDPRMNFRDVEIRILRPLAALNNKRRTDQIEAIAMLREVSFDLRRQARLGLGERLIHHHQGFMNHLRLIIDENFFQHRIGGTENVLSEMHSQSVTDLD